MPVLALLHRATPTELTADADFIAFKQQAEGEPELLPSAEVQLDLKEQAKIALAGLPS